MSEQTTAVPEPVVKVDVAPEEAPNSKILSFADIASTDDIKTEIVQVPEWGGSVKVKVFSKAEMAEIRRTIRASQKVNDGDTDEDSVEKAVLLTGLVEPTISPEQYNLLMLKSQKAVQSVINAILTINGMKDEAAAEREAEFPG